MKIIQKFSVPLLALVLLWACTDMLEQTDPTGPTGETFLQNSDELQLAVIGTYSTLTRQDSPYWVGIGGYEQFSDNTYNGSSITDGVHSDWTNFNYNSQNQNIRNIYNTMYQVISSANLVIEKGPEADVGAKELNQALGEVHFLRAYAHFFLTLSWGDVPIVTETAKEPSGFAPEASSAEQVYNQVIEYLQFAENNLAATAGEGGRVTSWAAKSMLAKVYLFGADELGKSEWYGLAEQKAFEVINNGPYGLFNDLPTPQENLESIFQTFNENGKEHIFSVNHFNSGANWSNVNIGTRVPMSMNPRQMRNNNNLWGFGWNHVYEALDVIWDDADARKDYNIWFQLEPVIVNGEETGVYDQTQQNRCCARPRGFGYQKFWYQEKSKNVNGSSTLSYPVLRYAELLLIAAEADLLSDGSLSGQGLTAINQVRNRAGLDDLTQAEVTIEKILEERRWELFGEAQRWFDFVRKRNVMPNYIDESFAMITANDTDGDDNDFAGFSKERHYKFPYPQSALDRNPNLSQKPSWGGG